jgi:hypothetical protein
MPTTVYGLSEAEVDSNTEISVHEIACLQSIGDVWKLNPTVLELDLWADSMKLLVKGK